MTSENEGFIDPAATVNQPFSFEKNDAPVGDPAEEEIDPATVPDRKAPEEESDEEVKDKDPPEKKEDAESKEKKEDKPKPKDRKSVPKFIKIDDKTVSEADLISSYRRNNEVAGQQEQTNDITKKAQAVIDAANSDPIAFLKSLGADSNKIREGLIKTAMEEEMLSEHEKDLRAEKRTSDDLREQLAVRDKAQKEADYNTEVHKYQKEIGDKLHSALEGSVLGQDKESSAIIIGEMANVLRSARKQGYSPSAEEIAGHVESKYFTVFKNLANGMESEALVEFMGKDIVKKLRAYDISKTKSKSPDKKNTAVPTETKKPAESNNRFIDPNEARIVK
jgi:hypothetical protein